MNAKILGDTFDDSVNLEQDVKSTDGYAMSLKETVEKILRFCGDRLLYRKTSVSQSFGSRMKWSSTWFNCSMLSRLQL